METYETTDIAVASFLLTKGDKMEDVDRTDVRRVKFIFPMRKDTNEDVKNFWAYKAEVCPLTFYQKLRELKMVVHCGKE